MSQPEQSMDQQFGYCEGVVDDLLKGRLGDSKSSQRNETLKNCMRMLQLLSEAVERLALFSANEEADEIPTNSLRFLLIPAYLASALQEINVEMDKRGAYLRASKKHYREFLESLSLFGLINFRLPWLDEENRPRDQGEGGGRLIGDSFEEAKARRQRTVSRLQQLEQLEKTLERLKNEKRRNDDEAAQREIIYTLLRLWSVRSVKELDMIEEELKMVEQFEMRNSHPTTFGDSACTSNDSKSAEPVRLKPFIIARSEAQKRVFGLGYPSVPTTTVDEWYDQTFGNGAKPSSFNIGQRKTDDDDDEEEDEEEETETKRRAQIRRDEWKDMNRRGCGNTYNKG
uniref:TAP42-like protein n=1 Tax=Globodera rostochiensis TaxID=31243 RepID=A0A914IC26_GLORO